MPATKLDNPACKLEIEDIVHIKNEDDSWVYVDAQLKFPIKLLWIQGNIKTIASDENEILLEENGKSIIVRNCKNIPGGNSWMQEGQYIMVFGEIQAIDQWTLNVKAIKISDLSLSVLHKQMWSYEVQESKLIYAEQKFF